MKWYLNFFFLILAIFLSCKERYSITLERGMYYTDDMLLYTQKLMPLSDGYLIYLRIPHSKDSFIHKNYLARFGRDFVLENFEVLETGIIGLTNNSLKCFRDQTFEEEAKSSIITLVYYDQRVTGQKVIDNSIVKSYRIDGDSIVFDVLVSSVSLYANSILKRSKDVELNLDSIYDIKRQMKYAFGDLRFDINSNEVQLLELSGSIMIFNKLKCYDVNVSEILFDYRDNFGVPIIESENLNKSKF